MFWWARPSRLFSMTAWKNTASNRPTPRRKRGTIPLLLEFECGAPGKRTHVHVHHHSPGIHRQPFFVHGPIFLLRLIHNLRNFRKVSDLLEFGNNGCLQI